jgi:hypothetical protein
LCEDGYCGDFQEARMLSVPPDDQDDLDDLENPEEEVTP